YDERDAMRFVFVSVPSRENVAEYKQLVEDVESRIGRINGKHATLNNTPVHFIHGSVQFDDLVALYALAEVCLVTPLIDGMNLVAKEYVACQREGKADPGVLVLSEFAGAAEELFSAIVVNPYDARQLSRSLRQALDMPADERRERMRAMRERVTAWDAGAWARAFVDDLSKPAARPATGSGAADPAEARERLRAAIAGGKRVALMLDYDGTLREFEREPHLATPTPEIRSLVERLAAVPNVDVTIISGRSAKDLESFWGEAPVALVAEHGAAVRRCGTGDWDQLDRNVSYAWKAELRKLLRLFADSTPGSFVEDKRTSLVWHYRKADPEFGDWKARQLVTELAVLTANAPLEVRHGRKIVEVTATQVNKGAAVLRVMEEARYDLTLVAGDDTTDESMFRLDLANLLTIKIGDGDTQAKYRVLTPAAFRTFLGSLVPGAASVARDYGRDAMDGVRRDGNAPVRDLSEKASQAPFAP
ncbi:MAG TPA: trehalose-phosphatase, partial [Tepidisphaeraceae bacterium]|nr:trehalose-phosphatase [Tepidisphaeraceae bacterium]